MSVQQGMRMETAVATSGSLTRRVTGGGTNGLTNVGQNPNGFQKKLRTRQNGDQTLTLSNNLKIQPSEPKASGTKGKHNSKDIGIGVNVKAGTTAAEQGGGTSPGSPFRERMPSFTIRRSTRALLQTHFAVYKFVARHDDELSMNVGDAIHVEKKHDDMWYEGENLTSDNHGVFPSRYVSDVLSDNGASFGSVEVFEFKGNNVLCQAVAKVLNMRKNKRYTDIPPCSLEVNHLGIKLVDHAQETEKRQGKSFVGRFFGSEQKVSQAKYFFKLKDVTFCGCYPNSPRYFGFVTKHPTEHRFACHTFISDFSTEPVAKAIGKAFRRFYDDYMERSSSR